MPAKFIINQILEQAVALLRLVKHIASFILLIYKVLMVIDLTSIQELSLAIKTLVYLGHVQESNSKWSIF